MRLEITYCDIYLAYRESAIPRARKIVEIFFAHARAKSTELFNRRRLPENNKTLHYEFLFLCVFPKE